MRSSLRVEFAEPTAHAGMWLPYRLEIAAGTRKAVLEESPGQVGRCWLGLAPIDELGRMVDLLDDLLVGKRAKARFEPAEPNFSLEIESATQGWMVVCWLDAGNQSSDHFTWDALGVRFFTNAEALADFRGALNAARQAALTLVPVEES